jgi:hypothetical protein
VLLPCPPNNSSEYTRRGSEIEGRKKEGERNGKRGEIHTLALSLFLLYLSISPPLFPHLSLLLSNEREGNKKRGDGEGGKCVPLLVLKYPSSGVAYFAFQSTSNTFPKIAPSFLFVSLFLLASWFVAKFLFCNLLKGSTLVKFSLKRICKCNKERSFHKTHYIESSFFGQKSVIMGYKYPFILYLYLLNSFSASYELMGPRE